MPKILTTGGAIGLLMAVVGLAQPSIGWAEIRSADLNTTRSVLEAEWLRLKLEVMALRLSYPAYRIELELDQENRIQFTFMAGGGMAEHLSELGPSEAKQMLAYHATGIRDKVTSLVREEFSVLWGGYRTEDDFSGRFLVPADDWSAPPRELAYWQADRLSWK